MTDSPANRSSTPPGAVAIIGIGARVPAALNAQIFWQNILDGHYAISEVPRDRWNPDLYWDNDRSAIDKTYSKIGGWVTGFEFERKKYRLPPTLVDSMDPTQTLCLEATHEALEDAGYLEKDFDRERCAVILGNAMGGDLRDRTNLRIFYAEVEEAVRMTLLETARGELSDDKIGRVLRTLEKRFRDELPRVTEDSMPGELANVVAGRVAALFDLRGPNFIADAACASSLAAISAAVHGLQAGQYDMAISGGIDRCMGAPTFVKFSKIGALSATGSRPFDAQADGFVMGEGGAILILKRLADAVRDGDKIYAVIRGIGAASDGKGKGITAPNPIGQKLAVRRAYQDAGYGPRSVSLFEAHGTSTPVGDPIEANSLLSVIAEDSGPWHSDHVGIGSIKSMIGHLKAGAGAVSLAKAALAIKNQTLPPSINVEEVNPAIEFGGTPIRVQTHAAPWETRNNAPRRAGVSAFGFGGTNFHVTLEEFDPQRTPGGIFVTAVAQNEPESAAMHPASNPMSSTLTHLPAPPHTALREDGILTFAGASEAEIRAQFEQFAREFDADGLRATTTRRLALESGQFSLPAGAARLAISYTSEDGLKTQIGRIHQAFERGRGWKILANQGIFLNEETVEGRLAMLFPGQGSQYIGMLDDLRERYPVVQATFDEADRIMMPVLGRTLSSIIFPDPSDLSEDQANELLRQTEVTQPAVLTVNIALLRLFEQFDIRPDMVAGHSLGEYGACVAAGVMSFADALRTVAARGTQMAQATPLNGDKGLMASIPASADQVQAVLDTIDGYVVCANKNCPKQTIIAGASDAVTKAVAIFEGQGNLVHMLNVSHAFHTRVVAAASEPLRRHLDGVEIATPQIPILTNVTGDFYPTEPDQIRDLLAEQLASPVEYIALIEKMYESGARIFIEVGPKRTQSTFVSATLGAREHMASYSNHPKEGGVGSLHNILARLWAHDAWHRAQAAATTLPGAPNISLSAPPTPTISATPTSATATAPVKPAANLSKDAILATILQVLCEKTGYDPSEIEFDFELEADLGIDTVKQAEIMADVREHFALAKDDDFRLADYPTLDHMADYVLQNLGDTQPAEVGSTVETLDAVSPATAASPASLSPVPDAPKTALPDRNTVLGTMLQVLCAKTGYDPDEIEFDFELEADLGIDTVKQAEIMADVREHFALAKDEDFRLADYPTLDRMADYVLANLAGAGPIPADTVVDMPNLDAPRETRETRAPAAQVAPALTAQIAASTTQKYQPVQHSIPARVSITGAALGLPGLENIFDEAAVDKLLAGQNFIGAVPLDDRQEMVHKRIVRVQKHKDGGGELVEVTDVAEVIKLAGRAVGDFDLRQWGVPERMVEQFDRTSQLAIAAGINALRDAGLPMVPRYHETRNGKKITIGWKLPDEIGDETGIIFASAFAGEDALIDEVTRRYTDPDYKFDHRFLVKVLGMANARFAEMIGARGPNTRINNACASTTTAIGMAEDWIRAGRCARVVIISADDASGDTLMNWVGSGFLATGAATTQEKVEDAALPFDRRRHGMIIGMGAVALVIEAQGIAEARGVEPLADVLATHFVNSAFHPTRLDVEHIAGQVGKLLARAEKDFHLDRQAIAQNTVFVSHETYTPARGGSAAAEIAALRDNFGPAAAQIVVANTKGFTGHAMGAGIEDVLAIKTLQKQRVPHIANFREPDPALGDLRLSQGGEYPVDYALRLAAGFGSQLAVALLRFRARRDDRVFDPGRYEQWLREISGFGRPELVVEERTLRLTDAQPEVSLDPPATQDSAPIAAETASTAQNAPKTSSIASENHEAKPEHPAQPSRETLAPAHDLDPRRFEPRPIVVEAHTAVAYDLAELESQLSGKQVVLLNGPAPITAMLVQAVESCGARAHLIGTDNQPAPKDRAHVTVDLCDEEAVRASLDAIGRVDGIINLLGYGQDTDTPDQIHRAARETFHVARAWAAHLGHAPGSAQFYTAITGMGGRLGFDASTHPLPMCGAIGGLTKALGREWPEAHVRAIDVAREGFYPELGLQILSQVLADAPTLEVGLIGGVRYVPVIVDAELLGGHGSTHSYAPDRDSVVLVVGGARGITAEVALDLARRFGPKLALVGRSKLSHPDPLGVDLDAEKRQARERVQARGQRVTPVAIENELSALKAQIEIAQNLKRMEEAGAQAAYFSCDVADPASVSVLMERVMSRFGKIDGIIHAAGVEESKLLADKDAESFDRVFLGKAIGGLNLWRAIRAYSPEFFIAFSSVAGRFGNQGQVDYSAANEVLNKLVAQINATTRTRALSIDWTAWEGVGMATHGSMRTILEARGVEFLPVEVGAPIVGDAMTRGMTGEYLVAGKLGEMGEDYALERSALVDDKESYASPHIFVDHVTHSDADSLVVERVFDPDRDYFINDHVYQGVAVLPGVMGFEFMVGAASALAKNDATFLNGNAEPRVIEVRDVSFEHAIKFHHGAPLKVIASARVARREGARLVVDVILETARATKIGRELQQQHFSAQVVLGQGRAARPRPMQLNADLLFETGPKKLEIYRRFFHTGSFQVLEEVPHVGSDAIIGYGRNPTGRLSASQNGHVFLTDPMVREMALQVAGLWGMKTTGMSYLPRAIGRALQLGSAQPGEGVCIRCRRRDDAAEHCVAFDVEILTQQGRLLQVMEKVELIGHRTLTDRERFAEFSQNRLTARRFTLPEAELLLSDIGLSVDEVLADEERKEYERIKHDGRRAEWLAARIAAKDLVFCHLRNFYGVSAALGEIHIAKDAHGAPRIALSGRAATQLQAVRMPHLTITHSQGVAIAAIAAPGPDARAGIDLEAVALRSEAFIEDYFSPAERALHIPHLLLPEGSDPRALLFTTLWTIKEAVSKALGLGLKLSTDEIRVGALGARGAELEARVHLSGRALDALNELTGTTSVPHIEVRAHLDAAFALAWAWFPRAYTAPGTVQAAPGGDLSDAIDPTDTHDDITPDAWVDIAAVAALLKHKGLLGRLDSDETIITREPISPWKQS